MKQSPLNIAHIAKLAGVHPSTVSRALNASPLVKEKTREKICRLARENGYIPHDVAKSLTLGKTLTLGVIVPEIANSFYAHIIREIEAVMGAQGYALLLAASGFDSGRQQELIRTMAGKRVDGLVMCAPTPEAEAALIALAPRLPIVLCDTVRICNALDSVYVDEYAGIFQAVGHLKAGGCRRIACIADEATRRRSEVFRRAMAEHGLSADESLIRCGGSGAAAGWEELHALHRDGRLPDALFCTRDEVAVGCLRAATELHIAVPQHLSLIGYDDASIAEYLHKKLTTVRQPAARIGKQVARLMQEKLAGGREEVPPATIRLLPELILRESSK